MEDKMTLAELKTHRADLEARAADIAAKYADRDFPADVEVEWEAIKAETVETDSRIAKREQRDADMAALARNADNVEPGTDDTRFSFQTRKASVVPDDPTDFAQYRTNARSMDELDQAYRDGARHIIADRFRHQHPSVSHEEGQGDVNKLIDRDQDVAYRVILTSRKAYRDQFADYMKSGGRIVGDELQRVASLTTTAGGFAVPVELDTSLILTNAGVISPIRQVARVRQTNVNTVEFLSTTGVTAAFGDEATEASDNAPTLAQPTANIEKAFAFIPGSIEVFQDWANIQQDMAMLFADAKERLESDQFLIGLGHGSHAPQGLIAVGGNTAIVTSATTAVMALADLYTLELALAERWRKNAVIFGSKAAMQKIRAFATATGPSAWADNLRDGYPGTALGYPFYEWSSVSSAVTTSASTVLVMGDPNQFAIVDRVGMDVEFIPHLFGSSNRYPTGQRALYAYWRTTSKPLTPGLSANSAFKSLKLL